MSDIVRILGISGSLRPNSLNSAALRAAQQLVPDGTTIEIYEGIGTFPYYDDELAANAFPPAVAEFKERIRAADGVLVVTPEYNHGIPGVLKNALDWGTRPVGDSAWAEKPFAMMGVATGQNGTARAQVQLRAYATAMNLFMLPRPEVLIGNARGKFDADLNFTDEAGRQFMQQHLIAFSAWIRRLRPAQ